MGGTAAAFFPTESDGTAESDSISFTFADFLDVFMHEYGWDLKAVLNHTPYQLKLLGSAIAKRTSLRSVSLASIIRNAYGADQNQFQEFIDSLMQFEGSQQEDNQQFL